MTRQIECPYCCSKNPMDAAFCNMCGSKIDLQGHAPKFKDVAKFVNREDSMEILMKTFKKARTGPGQIIGVTGKTGIGKSRIIRELQQRLHRDECTWHQGRCIQYGRSMSHLPVVDILKSFFNIRDGDSETIYKKKISNTLVDLGEWHSSASAPFHEILSLAGIDQRFCTLSPGEKREKTFEALRTLFIKASQALPLILVIEDMHWVDRTTEAFVHDLAGSMTSAQILLVLVYRPGYRHNLETRSNYTEIVLNQLDPASSRQLMKRMLEGADIVPDALREFISTWLGPLEEKLKRTLQVAPVIGQDLACHLLQAVTEMRKDLDSSLLGLKEMEFIYEKALFPELEYVFKHAMIQEAAYSSLLHQRRKEIHENIGKAVEEIYADRLEDFYGMLVYHYSKSGNRKKADHYLELSDEKSTGSSEAPHGLK